MPPPLRPIDALAFPPPDVDEPASVLTAADAAEASDAGGGVPNAFANDDNPCMTSAAVRALRLGGVLEPVLATILLCFVSSLCTTVA